MEESKPADAKYLIVKYSDLYREAMELRDQNIKLDSDNPERAQRWRVMWPAHYQILLSSKYAQQAREQGKVYRLVIDKGLVNIDRFGRLNDGMPQAVKYHAAEIIRLSPRSPRFDGARLGMFIKSKVDAEKCNKHLWFKPHEISNS